MSQSFPQINGNEDVLVLWESGVHFTHSFCDIPTGAMFNSILLPVDGSEESMNAAAMAVEIAAKFDATIDALYVTERYPVYTKQGGSILSQDQVLDEEHAYAEQVLADVEAIASESDVQFTGTVSTGQPSYVITEYAEKEGVDAIVLGKSGRSGLSERVIGSTAERVCRNAPITTIAVP